MIVVDTGPLVALAYPQDAHHAACRAWFETVPNRRDLIIPATVVAEACYLIEKFSGPRGEADFLADLAHGAYGTVTGLMPGDLVLMAILVRTYARRSHTRWHGCFGRRGRRTARHDQDRYGRPPTLLGRASAARRRIRAVPGLRATVTGSDLRRFYFFEIV